MWTTARSLHLCVKIGLRKGLGLIRGMRRTLTDEQQDRVAQAIVEHLELSNWKIEEGAPPEGHGPNIMPKS